MFGGNPLEMQRPPIYAFSDIFGRTDGRTDRQTPRYGIDRAAKINKRRYKVRNEDRYKYRRSIVVSIMMA